MKLAFFETAWSKNIPIPTPIHPLTHKVTQFIYLSVLMFQTGACLDLHLKFEKKVCGEFSRAHLYATP